MLVSNSLRNSLAESEIFATGSFSATVIVSNNFSLTNEESINEVSIKNDCN